MAIQIKNDNVLISHIDNLGTKYLPLSGGTLEGRLYVKGNIYLEGKDLMLRTRDTTTNDSGDIVWYYGNEQEKSRIWTSDVYSSTTSVSPYYRVYDETGTNLYSGRLQIEGSYAYNNAWNITSSSGELTTSLSITTHGRPVLILFSWDMQGTAAGHWCTGAVYRDSTHLKSRTVVSAAGSYNANGVITYLDVVSAGSYTYTFKLKSGNGTIQYNESNLYGNEQPVLCIFEI